MEHHRARRLHYDLRFEMAGVLASWAVPRGPTLAPAVRRMAVHVADHPIGYLDEEVRADPDRMWRSDLPPALASVPARAPSPRAPGGCPGLQAGEESGLPRSGAGTGGPPFGSTMKQMNDLAV